MHNILILIIFVCGAFAQVQDGISYWWLEDGKIDYQQKADLDALEDDSELWCALAELWVGQEEAAGADCVFEEEEEIKKEKGKKKRIFKGTASSGTSIDSMGNFQKYFLQTNLHLWKAFGDVRLKEKDITVKIGYNSKNISVKAGDLLRNGRGVYASANIGGFNFGGTYLRKEYKNEFRDTAWVFGKYSRNFLEKRFFAGVNFTNLWSRTWQGMRYESWTLQVTELALVGKAKDSIAVAAQITRKRKNAGLKLDWNEKRTLLSAGIKPVANSPDSIWAEARLPLRLRMGWNRNLQSVKLSQSLTVKDTFGEKKPLEFRQESRIKIPLPLSPSLVLRYTLRIYPSQRISLNQFYTECKFSF